MNDMKSYALSMSNFVKISLSVVRMDKSYGVSDASLCLLSSLIMKVLIYQPGTELYQEGSCVSQLQLCLSVSDVSLSYSCVFQIKIWTLVTFMSLNYSCVSQLKLCT